MFRQIGQRQQHVDAVDRRLAHADDAAATYFNTGFPDIGEGLQAIRKTVRGNDLVVIAFGRIDVVVVIIQTGLAETIGLPAVEHSKRHAGLHAKRLDALYHCHDGVHVAILGAAPCGAHAIAGGARVAGLARLGDNAFDLHQLRRLQPGIMMGRLAAIAAILGATAGLDAEKPAELHFVGIEVLAMGGLRLKQQITEGRFIKRQGQLPRPVHVAGCRHHRRHLV